MSPATIVPEILSRLDAAFGGRADTLGRLYGAFRPEVQRIIAEAVLPLAPLMAKVGSWTTTVRTEPLGRILAALTEASRAAPHHPLAGDWRRMETEARSELETRARAKDSGE